MKVPRAICTDNEAVVHRENCLKNVVMRIVIELRDIRRRPRLADFIKVYREKKNDDGAHEKEVKEEFQKKFKMLYSDY